MTTQTCSVTGCDRPAKVKSWCRRHYQRWWYYGDPILPDKRLNPHRDTILQLHRDNPAATQAEIGAMHTPPLTRQVVNGILHRHRVST